MHSSSSHKITFFWLRASIAAFASVPLLPARYYKWLSYVDWSSPGAILVARCAGQVIATNKLTLFARVNFNKIIDDIDFSRNLLLRK
jgi:hypothetical protein